MPDDVDRHAPTPADIDIGIERRAEASKLCLISNSVSADPPSDRADGLPDFLALVQAEIAAAEPAAARSRVTPSSLGVGEIVLTARELAGFSQRRLATMLSTSQPAIATIESGNRVPTVRTLMRIAEASGFELVIGLRSTGASAPTLLGAVVMNEHDGLADYLAMVAPSPFEGPSDR